MLIIENQSTFFQTTALPSLRPLRNVLLVLRATVALAQDWKISFLHHGEVLASSEKNLYGFQI